MHTKLKVAIQGDRASFHEIAAHKLYTEPIELTYCQTFAEVFDELRKGSVDKALVATSNSTHGIIDEAANLIYIYNAVEEAEYSLPITQHLIGLPSTDISKITTIISHPVALSQCSEFIKDLHQLNYHDTAAAVEYVKMQNSPTLAAIASEAAAKLHGLVILKQAIQDDPNNVTVFKSFVL